MRQIGIINNHDEAAIICNYLTTHDIECQLLEEGESFSIWILDDELLSKAKKIYEEFISNPSDPRFSNIETKKRSLKSFMQKDFSFKNEIKSGGRALRRTTLDQRDNQLTIILIIICAVVYFAMETGLMRGFIEYFYFSKYRYPLFFEIRNGQIWRFITPIFLHFGILHILFNMLWLYQLGSQIERIQGQRYLVILIMILAILSNTGEYLISQSLFGGMSGVVYGLLGFTWMMGKFKPHSGYYIDSGTVGFMLAWLILCMMGLFGNIANTTHVVGLMVGVAWGYIASGRFKEIGKHG